MVSLNKVMLIGNVGKDPEMRFTPSGNPVTSFSVATNRVFNTPEGEKKQETDWFNVVAWNKLAEQCNQFLSKGKLVYVEGRLRNRSWDGTDGQKHFRTEVIANRVTFLDRAGTGASTTSVEKSERLSELLKKKAIKHVVLNAKFHEREAEIAPVPREPAAPVRLRQRARQLQQRRRGDHGEDAEGKRGLGLHHALEASQRFHRVAQ